MNLFIDIGNTNLKIGYDNNILRININNIHGAHELFNLLPSELREATINEVTICSVVPGKEEIVVEMLKQNFDARIYFVGPKMKTGIKLNVDHPKLIGKDLVALSVYAASRSESTIIVNFGTATTMVYVKNKALEGAIIQPGVKTQFDALSVKASQISDMTLSSQDRPYGKNTQEAVSVGIINLVAEGIKSMINKIDKDALVIYSGGNSSYFSKLFDFEHVEEATLEGIKLIKRKNEK